MVVNLATDPWIESLIPARSEQASQCQQAFTKTCLVNLISKDTNLVFSIYLNLCYDEVCTVYVIFSLQGNDKIQLIKNARIFGRSLCVTVSLCYR